MKIYSQDLKDTCISLKAFDKIFPNGAEVNKDSIEKCQGIFDIPDFLENCCRKDYYCYVRHPRIVRREILNLEQTFYYQPQDLMWLTRYSRMPESLHSWIRSYELELLPPGTVSEKFYEIATGITWTVEYSISKDIGNVRPANIFISLSTNPDRWWKPPSNILTRPWSDLATVTKWKDLRELTAQWDYLDDFIHLKEGLSIFITDLKNGKFY